MRRRDRFAGIAWLGGFPEREKQVGMALVQYGRTEDTGQLLAAVASIGYVVEVEVEGPVATLRCLPVQNRLPMGMPKIGLSYTGTNLDDIAATAAFEVKLLASQQAVYSPVSAELQRWVP